MQREFALFGGWKETSATVWSVMPTSGSRRTVILTYAVARKPYSSEISTSRAFTPGEVIPLRYDPGNPARNEFALRYQAVRAALWGAVVLGASVAGYLYFLPMAP